MGQHTRREENPSVGSHSDGDEQGDAPVRVLRVRPHHEDDKDVLAKNQQILAVNGERNTSGDGKASRLHENDRLNGHKKNTYLEIVADGIDAIGAAVADDLDDLRNFQDARASNDGESKCLGDGELETLLVRLGESFLHDILVQGEGCVNKCLGLESLQAVLAENHKLELAGFCRICLSQDADNGHESKKQ